MARFLSFVICAFAVVGLVMSVAACSGVLNQSNSQNSNAVATSNALQTGAQATNVALQATVNALSASANRQPVAVQQPAPQAVVSQQPQVASQPAAPPVTQTLAQPVVPAPPPAQSAPQQVAGGGGQPITPSIVQGWCSPGNVCAGRLIPLEQVSQPGDKGVKLQTGHPVSVTIPAGVSADTYFCEGNTGPPRVTGPATIQGVCEASFRGNA